jgi:hypothetical protein
VAQVGLCDGDIGLVGRQQALQRARPAFGAAQAGAQRGMGHVVGRAARRHAPVEGAVEFVLTVQAAGQVDLRHADRALPAVR